MGAKEDREDRTMKDITPYKLYGYPVLSSDYDIQMNLQGNIEMIASKLNEVIKMVNNLSREVSGLIGDGR